LVVPAEYEYNKPVTHTTIILVHYNSDQETTNCLRSLDKISLPIDSYTVVVVDNGSTIPFEKPQLNRETQVHYLRSEANLGFTGGNNLGIHYAIEKFNSDYIILLNNDTYVAKDAFKILIEHASTHAKAGIVAPKIYFAEGREYHRQSYQSEMLGTVLWYAGGSIDWQHLVAFHRGVDELDRGQFTTQAQSEFATGCCMLIKREIFEKIGLLDRRYFLYLEDVDFNMRTKQFGYEVHYVDDAQVWHVNAGSSSGSGSQLHVYYQTRNRLLFFEQYGTWQVKLVLAKLVVRYLFSGSKYERLGTMHYLMRQFGKQPII